MPYPKTPIAGTGLTDPLLTPDQYRKITSDTSVANEDITTALLEAEQMVCELNDRTMRYGNYEETLFLYPSGMVYPSATPFDPTHDVLAGGLPIFSAPDDQNQTQAIIQANGIWIGWFQPAYIPVWTGVVPPQTIINYWGGYMPYQGDGGNTEALPVLLAKILARVAYYSMNVGVLAGVSGSNIKSLGVGGVNISGDLESFMQFDGVLRRDIRRWRKPSVVGWDA